MKIPVSWLKDFVAITVAPEQLADDLTSVGLACDGIERFGDEAVLDLDITTNRVDAMNVYGVAREAAAFYSRPLKPLDLTFTESGSPAADVLKIEIEAPALCPRFVARVFEVRPGPSPAWLRKRIELAGQRSISNIVDLTNYVMLEMGQPSHAFDLKKLRGGVLKARMAAAGETVETLDGVVRTLTAAMGVVADAQSALAIAGVMGGASSEISDDTRTVALEAAYWNPLLIRRASRALGMHTDASHRFERGADPAAGPAAISRFAHLLARDGMGSARPGLVETRGDEIAPRRLTLSLSAVDARLGAKIPAARTRATLEALGLWSRRQAPGTTSRWRFLRGAATARAKSISSRRWRGITAS